MKFQYGIIVLSVSKMPIFRNRPDTFNALFGHDKQNFVLFPVISVFLKNRAISYSKRRCFEGVFLRNVVIFSSLNPGGRGVLPYKGLMGTCGQPGYVFRDFCLKQGIEFIIFCLNQGIDLSIFVLNRISFLGR